MLKRFFPVGLIAFALAASAQQPNPEDAQRFATSLRDQLARAAAVAATDIAARDAEIGRLQRELLEAQKKVCKPDEAKQ